MAKQRSAHWPHSAPSPSNPEWSDKHAQLIGGQTKDMVTSLACYGNNKRRLFDALEESQFPLLLKYKLCLRRVSRCRSVPVALLDEIDLTIRTRNCK